MWIKKNNDFIPRTPTFVRPFLYNVFGVFEYSTHMGQGEQTPTLLPSPLYGGLLEPTFDSGNGEFEFKNLDLV